MVELLDVWMTTDLWWFLLLFLSFCLLCHLSTSFNYIVKFVYLYTAYIVVSVPIVLLLLPFGRHPRNGLLATRILRCIHWPISVEFSMEHEERLLIPSGGAAVLVFNHQSAIDLMTLVEIWPKLGNAAPIAKKELLYTGPFGLAVWLIGGLFIDRTSKSSKVKVNNFGELARMEGTKMIVFPEGTRNSSKDLSLLPFKKGAFHVAVDGCLSIIPLVISHYDFLDHDKQRFSPGCVTVRVLPRIETDGFTRENLDTLVDKTRDAMTEALRDLARKGKGD